MTAIDPATMAQTCRKLFLRDHVVEIMLGAHDFEKVRPQRVIFNVELFVPYADSTPKHDSLAEVVDCDFVREVIRRRVQDGHIVLQETLCDDLATTLLEHPQVMAVRLSSCKPDVYPDCAGVGVEVFRSKDAPQ